ncbi:hypothetical protein KHA80_20775 [Anaerobacillus sp. HL2]|nr:hypothetical protein KHA80_20775 [Anaerobacillus sp. HL2]
MFLKDIEGVDTNEMNYEEMTTNELLAYYKRVKDYIDQGFRVEGLKDELNLISITLKRRGASLFRAR